ncbi:RadC family protein [Anaerotalea alkaliphila]|uniref:JAB domain-containing protein n=1 Tax=Anaerotalea alkaliphila TaxID=2662126 RepID=A0A7X5KMG1_9FIRM|nr:DNA repair protein RadC [Anaerotalea alkaliphila]NDL67951.1 JAB domain-containing protein [Anaerotalea alkaliphila]
MGKSGVGVGGTTIKEMPFSERPYEKLEQYGPQVLSDAELLAIIIRSGTRNDPSVSVARQILQLNPRGLGGIHQLTLEELKEIDGIGRVKSIQIKAIAELSKRLSKLHAMDKVRINSPSTVANIYMEEMRYLEQEHLKIVMLDTKNQITGDSLLSIGTVNASLVNPREVFIHALKQSAVQIILVHNHPSGDPEPSREDIAITNRVKEAGELLGIHLLDHLVIGDGSYISLKERNLC